MYLISHQQQCLGHRGVFYSAIIHRAKLRALKIKIVVFWGVRVLRIVFWGELEGVIFIGWKKETWMRINGLDTTWRRLRSSHFRAFEAHIAREHKFTKPTSFMSSCSGSLSVLEQRCIFKLLTTVAIQYACSSFHWVRFLMFYCMAFKFRCLCACVTVFWPDLCFCLVKGISSRSYIFSLVCKFCENIQCAYASHEENFVCILKICIILIGFSRYFFFFSVCKKRKNATHLLRTPFEVGGLLCVPGSISTFVFPLPFLRYPPVNWCRALLVSSFVVAHGGELTQYQPGIWPVLQSEKQVV